MLRDRRVVPMFRVRLVPGRWWCRVGPASHSAADAHRSRSHWPASAARAAIRSRPDTAARSAAVNAARTPGAHDSGTSRGSRPATRDWSVAAHASTAADSCERVAAGCSVVVELVFAFMGTSQPSGTDNQGPNRGDLGQLGEIARTARRHRSDRFLIARERAGGSRCGCASRSPGSACGAAARRN